MVTSASDSAAEKRAEATRRRKGRRNAIVVIGIMNVLVLVDGFSGASDIRRVSTPQGAAAAWADAASAADCDTYVGLEAAGRLATDLAGVALGPTVKTRRGGLCQRVADAWLGVSVQQSDVVGRAGDVAIVRLTVTGQDGSTLSGEVLLRRQSGRWRVGLAPPPCIRPAYSPKMSLCPDVTLPST